MHNQNGFAPSKC